MSISRHGRHERRHERDGDHHPERPPHEEGSRHDAPSPYPEQGLAALAGFQHRLAELEQRVRVLEDERAISRLILSYGPLVDGGHADDVAALWEPDGVYDVDEWLMNGRHQIAAMVRSSAHQGWIAGGCAHVAGPPHVTVTGDDAVAVGYTLMVVHGPSGFTVRRATANRWVLRRTPEGWRVTDRTSRMLDGRDQAPALLADGPLMPSRQGGTGARPPGHWPTGYPQQPAQGDGRAGV